MSAETAVALLGGVAAVLGVVLRLWVELRATHKVVNSRMDELLDLTRKASLAQGRLAEATGNGATLEPPESQW